MSSPAAVRDSVYALLAAGDFEAVKRATPAGFDWTQLSHRGAPPLTLLLDQIVLKTGMGPARAVECAKWMISQGASPTQFADSDCSDSTTFFFDYNQKESTIECTHKNRTPIEVITQILKEMKSNKHWKERAELKNMERLLAAFTAAPLANPSKHDMQAVDPSVVGMWEDVLADEACQDLTFECEGGGTVGAHALVLSCASPVLRAMVSSRMREGTERKIEVDESVAAVKLFLELVYTGGSSADPLPVPDALAALDLAHRWDVVGVVGMLERAIAPLIKKQTFAQIAEAAALKDLPLLKSSCVKYASQEGAMIDELAGKGELPPVVLTLVGKRVSAAGGEPAAKKPRRSF